MGRTRCKAEKAAEAGREAAGCEDMFGGGA